MKQISTPELLVKHLYLETDIAERNQVMQLLVENEQANAAFQQLSEAKRALDDEGGENAQDGTLNNILRYSKRSFPTTI